MALSAAKRCTGIVGILSFALLLCVVGCPRAPGGPCEETQDCLANEICSNGTCRQACNSNADCKRDFECKKGSCHPARGHDAAVTGTEAATIDSTGSDVRAADRILDGAFADLVVAQDTRLVDRAATDASVEDSSCPGIVCNSVCHNTGSCCSSEDCGAGNWFCTIDRECQCFGERCSDDYCRPSNGCCQASDCGTGLWACSDHSCQCSGVDCQNGHCREASSGSCCDHSDCQGTSWPGSFTCSPTNTCECAAPNIACTSDAPQFCRTSSQCCADADCQGDWTCTGGHDCQCDNGDIGCSDGHCRTPSTQCCEAQDCGGGAWACDGDMCSCAGGRVCNDMRCLGAAEQCCGETPQQDCGDGDWSCVANLCSCGRSSCQDGFCPNDQQCCSEDVSTCGPGDGWSCTASHSCYCQGVLCGHSCHIGDCCQTADCTGPDWPGEWTCETASHQCQCGDGKIVCGQSCRDPDICGGCAEISEALGAPCGAHGCGQWACDGVNLVCQGDHPRARFWIDVDQDTWGGELFQELCQLGEEPYPQYTATRGGDCQDDQVDIHPEQPEVCDGVDNNCVDQDDGADDCAGGSTFCCGSPATCAECCNPEQCGTGAFDCINNTCQCPGPVCGNHCADIKAGECCTQTDCGGGDAWTCEDHQCRCQSPDRLCDTACFGNADCCHSDDCQPLEQCGPNHRCECEFEECVDGNCRDHDGCCTNGDCPQAEAPVCNLSSKTCFCDQIQCDDGCYKCCSPSHCGPGSWGCHSHECACLGQLCPGGGCAREPLGCCSPSDCGSGDWQCQDFECECAFGCFPGGPCEPACQE